MIIITKYIVQNKGLTFKNARKKRYSCTLHTHLVATL